jgi:carboxymethylenebutenolidase
MDVVGESTPLGYLSRPEAPGEHPGVIVGMEMFGVTQWVRDVTDRIAGLGYVAIAPNLYRRVDGVTELPQDEGGRRRGFELVAQLTREQVLEDVRLSRDVTGASAIVGFSFGGHVAYLAATQLPFEATVVFYGGWLTSGDIPLGRPEPTLTLTPGITGELLYLVGEQDHAVPAADRAQIAAALEAAGVRHEFVVYPRVPHGFFCDARETFDPVAAEDAWERVTRLLASVGPRAGS